MKTISSLLLRGLGRGLTPAIALLAFSRVAFAAAPVTLNLPNGFPSVPFAGTVLNWTNNINTAVQMGLPNGRWYGDFLTITGPQGTVWSGWASDPGTANYYYDAPGIFSYYFYVPVTLAPNTTYNWQITMYAGLWPYSYSAYAFYTTSWSSFTTIAAPNVQLVSPTEWTGVPINTAFTWDATPGATSYELKVWIEGGGPTVIDTIVNGTSYQPSTSFPYTQWYYWSVRAIYPSPIPSGPWAPTWWFRTIGPPIGPIYPSPYPIPVIHF